MKSNRKLTVVIEQDEDGNLVGSVPAITVCHTQAKNLDTLMKRIREAIEPCLEDRDAPESDLELTCSPGSAQKHI